MDWCAMLVDEEERRRSRRQRWRKATSRTSRRRSRRTSKRRLDVDTRRMCRTCASVQSMFAVQGGAKWAFQRCQVHASRA
eukprot:2467524-Rhodomonas_salina.2